MNHFHRWRILIPVCFATVGLWTVQPAAGQKLLRWKLQSGAAFDYQIAQEIEQELKPANSPVMKFNTSQTMALGWDVKSVAEDGTMTVEQVVQTFQMRMQSPQGIMMEYDSTSDEKPTGLATMLGPMLESFVNRPMLTVYTPRGEVKEMKLPQGFLDKVNQLAGGGQLGNLFSDDWMKQFSQMGVLPEDPVTPGYTWQSEATIKNPILGQMKVVTSSRYEGTEVRDGRSVEKISLTIQFTPDDDQQTAEDEPGQSAAEADQDAEKQPGMIGIREQSGEGVLYFDAEAGLLYESQSRTKMKMSIDILGQKMEQDMVMVMTMKFKDSERSTADSTDSSQP